MTLDNQQQLFFFNLYTKSTRKTGIQTYIECLSQTFWHKITLVGLIFCHCYLIKEFMTISLFPKIKSQFQDCNLGNVDILQQVLMNQLNAVWVEEFDHCFWKWEQRQCRCVVFQGNYFEEDKLLELRLQWEFFRLSYNTTDRLNTLGRCNG